MKVLHPLGRRIGVLVWVLAFVHGAAARAGAADADLPRGICGSPQATLQARQAGSLMMQQVVARGMPWSDPALNEYVSRLGQKLARSSGSEQAFSFYVLYNPEPNAQAFPGGFVVVNSGIISLAETEGELASVLSHEIAHENACDWHATPRKANLAQLIGVIPAVVVGGPAGMVAATASGWAAEASRARFRRGGEERADRLAALYLARAGYDPQASVQFFQRLEVEQQRAGGDPGGLMATHPRTVDRARNVAEIIPSLPPANDVAHDDAEFRQMRQAVRAYDAIYSSITGVRVPGQAASPPVLSRRPPEARLP